MRLSGVDLDFDEKRSQHLSFSIDKGLMNLLRLNFKGNECRGMDFFLLRNLKSGFINSVFISSLSKMVMKVSRL